MLQRSTCHNVAAICHKGDHGIGLRVRQCHGICEDHFSGLEDHSLGGAPLENLQFFGEGTAGGNHHSSNVRQESVAVINHSHELLQCLHGGGDGELVDSLKTLDGHCLGRSHS